MESDMLLQLGQMRDVGTLQPSTLNVCGATSLRVESLWWSSTVSKSVASFVYVVATVWTLPRAFAEDFLAVHGAVRAVSVIAVALLSARGSVLQIEVVRAVEAVPRAVLRKVANVLHWSAEDPWGGIGAV